MKVLKWHNTDSQSLFDYHIKRFPKIFQHWADNPIEYSINSAGFRSYFEFEPDKSKEYDLFLGCSHTFGSSHPWENTWPYIVSKNTGHEVVNLGIGGAGSETSFKNLLTYIDKFRPSNIFHYQPLYSRYDFIDFRSSKFKNYESFDFRPFQPQWDGDESDYSPYSHQYIQNVMVTDRYMYYNQIYIAALNLEAMSLLPCGWIWLPEILRGLKIGQAFPVLSGSFRFWLLFVLGNFCEYTG